MTRTQFDAFVFLLGVSSLTLVMSCTIPPEMPSGPSPVGQVQAPAVEVGAIPMRTQDCDMRAIGAIRCYNQNDVAVTITAALNSLACDTEFSRQTVTIPPKSNGYFTLGMPCGHRGQVDFFFGARVGECRYPDFTSQRVYTTEACEVIPPPPPLPEPPPPPFPPPCKAKRCP